MVIFAPTSARALHRPHKGYWADKPSGAQDRQPKETDMTDFITKARKNRIIALNLNTKGSVMFFPEDDSDVSSVARRSVTHVSKPMFVRSQAFKTSAMIETPNSDTIANDTTVGAPHDVLVLTEDLAISEVMRLAA
jgi:hypothetical protein